VLQVITGMEDEVVKLIEDYTHPKIRKVHLLKDSFGAPLFPGYIFVEMELDSDTYRPVLDTPFVVQYLCPTSGIYPLGDLDVSLVNDYECSSLEPGLLVEVIGGSLCGLCGILLSVDFPRITIGVDIYGEPVEFTFSIRHVRVPGLIEVGLADKKGGAESATHDSIHE